MQLATTIKRFVRACLLGVLAATFAVGTAGGNERSSILVVTSRDDGPYEGVLTGVNGALEEARISVHSLQSDGDAAMVALQTARRHGSGPVLTIGSAATRAALEAPGDAPVVACMVVNERDLEKADNATGVVLEFPIETQLKSIQRFVPRSQTIGVLYNPAENQERIEEATRIADRLGVRLVPREVHRPQDLPSALESLAQEADILWAITDKTVLSRKTAQAILLYSFRNRMPFSGLSASWVKAGALYALERDYEDMGAQCAEMADKVARGRRPSSLPPAKPRKVVYTLNLKTAEHLKLSLPPELVDGAAEVYR